jgi:hypothetical protein
MTVFKRRFNEQLEIQMKGIFYMSIIQKKMLVVFYECETWWLILSEERRLRASENRVLRRIFGPKRDEVTGE